MISFYLQIVCLGELGVGLYQDSQHQRQHSEGLWENLYRSEPPEMSYSLTVKYKNTVKKVKVESEEMLEYKSPASVKL